ncbi:hypothetical protein [Clostridium perfringens]|uniref:hypothetical protein n=1 Tax=Clostridium perfringens TaxID=1502 RepID=UPI0022481B45|nr:hypothetical protein [Clostridium perfringens]MCX0414255.1 hypothetical protein [Clostridium perfringens]
MKLLALFRSILTRIERNNNSIFKCPVEKQEQYINSFRTPKDDIERSYYQYRCQMQFNKKIIVFGMNIVSLPFLLFYYFKKSNKIGSDGKAEAVFFPDGKPENIIPDKLKKEYSTWRSIKNKKENLSVDDKKYFREIVKRYPFSWQFLLKCLIKIRFYSYEIFMYHPKAIVVCNEYSFTSSILTKYCEERGIEHINVMHGEKLFYIRDSFFRFHRCYAWNDQYVQLFKLLRADEEQFKIAVPNSIKFINGLNSQKIIDYTYYLGGEEGKVLDKLMELLNQLAIKGNVVSLRPHPRYSNIEKIKSYSGKFQVEDTDNISIEQSVLRTRYAISMYSTVLNQAYHNGTGVVIDDITQPDIYKKLIELKYIMLETPHKTLSDILGG